MPREESQARAERIKQLLAKLRETYPTAHCELLYSNPLELLIATILSAQCTDKQVNLVTPNLFKKYRSAADFAQARLPVLEDEIRRLGFFRNKAKNIQGCCQRLVERHGGQVPNRMADLVQLPGVGRKTANVVLGNAFDVQTFLEGGGGVVVDTHVARLSKRLGLTRHAEPLKIEADLQKLIPQNLWPIFSHWLIWHGRRRCFARNPDCAHCEVLALCPRIGVAKTGARS